MKKILVYGLGVTGISSVKTLASMGYDVYTYDKFKKSIKELEGYKYSPISDFKDENFDFILKSPGIKPSDEVVKVLSKNSEILSDIEVSYRLFKDKEKIAITGTNGKTSTTSMVTHIINESGKKAISVGNIGEGILWQMYKNDGVFVEELSSFQLHDIKDYHVKYAAILNIKEDHIDWHGTFDDYKRSKLNISKNQTEEDFLVINYDDEILKSYKDSFKAQVYEFSSSSRVEMGAYLKDGVIYLVDGKTIPLVAVESLPIIGRHNYENAMAAILLSYLYGIGLDQIVHGLKSFKAIAHRLEFVKTIGGVDYYNDSKGTNVDSSVKAIESFDRPLIIIAGGYDKKIDYEDFVKAFKKNGKIMVLIGETKDKLKDLCEKHGISWTFAADMDQAVKRARDYAKKGDVVLLSPASASWDMYKSYEERGEDFKNIVGSL